MPLKPPMAKDFVIKWRKEEVCLHVLVNNLPQMFTRCDKRWNGLPTFLRFQKRGESPYGEPVNSCCCSSTAVLLVVLVVLETETSTTPYRPQMLSQFTFKAENCKFLLNFRNSHIFANGNNHQRTVHMEPDWGYQHTEFAISSLHSVWKLQ